MLGRSLATDENCSDKREYFAENGLVHHPGRCRRIHLYEPVRGMLCIKVSFEGRVELDGMSAGHLQAGKAEVLRLEKGEHRVEIFAQD